MSKDIRKGLKEFKKYHANEGALFEKLSTGQWPETVFITCADSRIDPNLLTNTNPGDLFVIRTAGNMMPAYPSVTGESASLEYALNALPIKEIVVCGHSSCGAIGGLRNLDKIKEMSLVSSWLEQGLSILDKEAPKSACTNETDKTALVNICEQVNNLKTHPLIKEKFDKGELKLTGWFFDISQGSISEWNGDEFKRLD